MQINYRRERKGVIEGCVKIVLLWRQNNKDSKKQKSKQELPPSK